jgi:hypothetical protein
MRSSHSHTCIKEYLENITAHLATKKKRVCLRSLHQQNEGVLISLLSTQSEASANDLPSAEPRVQLNAKECRDASVLNFQVASVSPQLLHLIKLFPECFIATRNAAREARVSSKN